MTENEQIADYLSYYFGLTEPQYAVMLKGPWGSGKTWFIEQCLKRLDDEQKYLYVSLYGVSSKKEIEDQFFEQLHPFLAHKGAKVAAKVVKGLLKGTLNFDWNGDGKADGAAAVGVPDLNVGDILKSSENGLILIFDDIERCDIPMPQLMGYINYFVEHDACRVVLLANEDEILANEEKKASTDIGHASTRPREHVQYLRIREKLIGKSFEIRPSLQSALQKFVSELPEGDGRDAIVHNGELITELHAASKYENLRHLRQALLDFARIVDAIDPTTRNQLMLKDILGTFLAYTFEIRSGNLRAEDIEGLNDYWSAFVRDDRKDKLKELRNKYVALGNFDSVFSGALWTSIMRTGLIDKLAVNAAVMQSKYYAEEKERPDWLRLWDAFSLNDSELTRLLSDVQTRLQQCGYTVLGELMHVTGALLSLSSVAVYPVAPKQILEWAIANAEGMRLKDQLLLSKEDSEMFTLTAWAGRKFHGSETEEFKEFVFKVQKLRAEAQEASYPSAAKELLRQLQSEPVACARQLYWSGSGDGRFARQPVLAHIDPDVFVSTVTKMQASDLAEIARAIESRYDQHGRELMSEKPWLEKVAKLLEPTLTVTGKMSAFYIRILHGRIVQAANALRPAEG